MADNGSKSKTGSEMRMEIVKITPQMAREWLEIEPDYPTRTIRKRNVSKILYAINEGEWRVTHQGIALGPRGEVLDGRHRLTAISMQRKHVPCMVAFNCDPELFQVADTGASRTPGDVLKTAGFHDVNVLSAATRQVIAYPELIGTASTLGSITNNLTNTHILKALQDPDLGKNVEEAIPIGGRIANQVGRYGMRTSSSVLVAVINLYSSQGEDTREEFFTRTGDGLHLSEGSPIHTYRRWLIREKGMAAISGTYRPTAVLAVGIRAWNDWVAGEERHVTRYRPARDIMPEVS